MMLGNLLKSLSASRSAVDAALRGVDEIRVQIAEQKAEIARIEAAPVPVADAMAVFDKWADREAASAMDRLRPELLSRPGSRGQGLTLPLAIYRSGNDVTRDLSPGLEVLFGLILAASRPAIRAMVEARIVQASDGSEPMTENTREKKLSQAHAALLELELAEESAIRSLETAGINVARRADADPAAVLADAANLPS